MIGAITGDIAGSRFEFHNRKSKDFELLSHKKHCHPTDDSIMTIAVGRAILDCSGNYEKLSEYTVKRMQEFGREYPHAGYGGTFYGWIFKNDPKPYNSWGNGAAMRVSACGFAGSSMEEVKALSYMVTSVTHDHPEGLKGAEATACAIYLARKKKSMDEIKEYILSNYYKIDFTLDDIRKEYSFDVSCQGSVPQAFEAFFESKDFEDAIRNAVSIGGDSDTIAAIAGGIAQAYYGIPDDIREKALTFLDDKLKDVVFEFEDRYNLKV